MICTEILAGVGNEFAVCGMIDCLNPNNLPAQHRHVPFDMLYELNLGICGPRNEHYPSIGDRVCHALKEILILRCVATADTVGLV